MSGFASKLKNMIPFLESETDQLKKVARHMTDDSLRSFAARNNLRVQRTETGDFISVPVDTPDNAFMSFYESWTSTFSNTGSFTAPSAGLYAQYEVDNTYQTAGTGEFTLRASTESSYITGLLLKSSTTDSTKKFKITVDDSGTLKATEV